MTAKRPTLTLQRHKEHYEIAESFKGREFSRPEFRLRYRKRYPTRPTSSMIATDFCVNRDPGGVEHFAKFLRWVRTGWYQMLP